MKQITYLLFLFISSFSFGQQAIITGYVDSPCSGALGRTVEIYVDGTIDFTGWNLVRQSNGAGYTANIDISSFNSITDSFIYVTNSSSTLSSEFGISTNVIETSAINDNGNDAFQIIDGSSNVIDRFGEENVDGGGTAWDHLDSYYYRKDGESANGGSFSSSNWTFGEINLLDGEGLCNSSNALSTFVPFGSFMLTVSNNPSLTISSPVNNQELNPGTTSVDVVFSTQNFDLTGGNFVEYTVNSGAALTTTTSPITITTTNGQSYTVTLELKDAGGSLSPQVIETINFSVADITNVSTIAELRAGAQGEYYTLTGEAIVTYTQTSRNQKFIEDATAAILIDDNNGVITNSYTIGDGITGLSGQLGNFNGLLQFVPIMDPGTASSTGNTLTPQDVTLAELSANSENYESELVRVLEVTIDNSVNANWVIGQVYALTQNTDPFNFRTSFADADYLDQPVQTFPANITGIITERSGNSYFITARDTNDFEAAITDPILTITGPSADQVFDYTTTEVNIEFTTENFDLTGDNFVEYIVNSGAAETTTTSPITVNVMPGTSYTVSLELKDGMGSLNPQVLETITFSTEVAPPSLPIIEQFDYIIGEDLGNQILWDAQNTGDEILINDGNLSYEGLASNIGNSISFDGSGKDLDLQFTTVNSGKVYSSFLIRVTDRTNFTSAGYFTALRENGGAFGPRVFLDPTTNSDEFRIGIGNNRTTTVFSTEVYTTNTDIFIVSSYDITTGVANLWINPVAGDAEPTTTLTETDDTPLPNVSSFLVRQDSGSTTPFIIMDELKLGTSWESVTEATLSVADFNPQDRSFKFYPNPVKDGVIHFSSDSTENTEIKIFNILGKEMIYKKLDGSSINVSNLSQGVYLAQIIVDGQKAATTKIIIR